MSTLPGGAPRARPLPGRRPGRLDDNEERPGTTGERGEPIDPCRDRRPTRRQAGRSAGRSTGRSTGRQVEDEQVDRPGREEVARHRQALVERVGDEDGQPFDSDATGDRLDRIEAPPDIDPGDDRTTALGLGSQTKGERRDAGRARPRQGDAPATRHARRPEDGVEGGEARSKGRLEPREPIRRARQAFDLGKGLQCQRANDRGRRPRRGVAPAHPKRRESRREVAGGSRHRHNIEHLFY